MKIIISCRYEVTQNVCKSWFFKIRAYELKSVNI